MSERKRWIVVGIAASLAVLCVRPATAGDDADVAVDEGPVMERLVDRYATDRSDLESNYGMPLSATRLDRMERFTRAWIARLESVNFEKLPRPGRVDYLLLRGELEWQLGEVGFARERNAETLALLPFASDILDLEESRRRLEELDPMAAARRLAAIADSIEAIEKRVEAGLDPKKADPATAALTDPVVAYRASRVAGRLKSTLDDWFKYRDGYEPDFGWWTRTPFKKTKKALDDYAKFLREKVAKVEDEKTAPLMGDPVGRDALRRSLDHELIPYGPEELQAIARREFAWCEAEATKAAKELGFDGDWHKAVEHVKGLHVPPGEQDDLVTRQARDAIAFLDERGLVTVPDLCRETWRLEMIPAKTQKTLPFAVYWGQKMGVAYPTEDMDLESKLMTMRGNNIHFSRIVTPHELIPGHHLQIYMAERHRTHRRLFRTPFLVEGWALYWEMRLWDLGYPRGPEDRVGMLFWRMHRCARILVSLGFHLGEMQPQEMIDFLVTRVGLEREGATSEVRRYIAGGYGPLYQCAYMIGGLQMRALHRELVASGRMSERDFHDAVLRENAIPVVLIRAALGAEPLTRDTRPAWRFAGEVR